MLLLCVRAVCPQTNGMSIPLTPMRYILRADASQSMGSGHVMRSSAIAEELISRGAEVIFVGKISNLEWVKNRITNLGFAEIFQNPSEFVSKSESDVLILDSYEIALDNPFLARSNWFKFVAIVDEQTPNYLCDLRVHPGLDATWVGDSVVPIIGGPKFIPIRTSLSQYKAILRRDSESLRIAVVAGGSDPYNLVPEIAKILSGFSEEFEVLLFSNSNLIENLDPRFQLIQIGNRFEKITQEIDLVLTTSSTTSLEFIARGHCVGVACAVDNQEQYYAVLAQLGAAAQIGFRNSSNNWMLDVEMIHKLITSYDLRAKLMSNSVGLIDFKGAKRIVDAIQALGEV